jgi:hypothetical protein
MTIHVPRPDRFFKGQLSAPHPVRDNRSRHTRRTIIAIFREASLDFVAGNDAAYPDVPEQIEALLDDAFAAVAVEAREQIRPEDE